MMGELSHWQFGALLQEQETEHDIGYHTAIRYFSLGKVLKSLWDLRAEIWEFCQKKGKNIPKLWDAEQKADLEFAVDVTVLHISTSDTEPDFNVPVQA